jgi:hypothetical protein
MRCALERSVAYALIGLLWLGGVLAAPACTWSTACGNGKITTQTLPDATVGQAYSFQLEQSCGSHDAASWQLLDDQPPPGITLSWDGLLFGTPTVAGSFGVRVSLILTSRASGGITYQVGSDSRTLTLVVRP